MIYTSTYTSPIGDILLASQNNELIGLWFKNQNFDDFFIDTKRF